MSKSKAFLYSLGAPALYLLLQFAVLFSISIYIIASSLSDGIFPAVQSEFNDFIFEVQDKLLALTLPALLISGVLFLLILLISHRKKAVKLWESIGITRAVSVKTLVLAALAGLSFHIACQGFILATPVPQRWHDANDLATQAFADMTLFTFFISGLFIPFIEEVAFRGFTQRILHHAFSPWATVILQGVIFGAFHANALQTIYAFATAILIGYIYMKSRNLWAAMCCHMAFNSANYLMAFIFYAIYGENGEPGGIVLALMAAGGTTLALLLARNITRKGAQNEEME